MTPEKDMPANETPAFKAAVAQAVAAALPALLAQLTAARDEIEGQPPPDFAKALALEIAKISGQGTGRQYVDPVILEQREAAKVRLSNVLLALRDERQALREQGKDPARAMPAWRLVAKTQLSLGPTVGAAVIEPLYRDEYRVVQKTEIDWPAIPNLAMRPINRAAERVWTEFSAIVGHIEISDADALGAMALTRDGAVVRGKAAATLLRNDPAARSTAAPDPLAAAAVEDTANVRRGNSGTLRKVHISPAMAPIAVG